MTALRNFLHAAAPRRSSGHGFSRAEELIEANRLQPLGPWFVISFALICVHLCASVVPGFSS